MEKAKANSLNEKLQRFIELSKEFTVGSVEVYGNFSYDSGGLSINADGMGFYGVANSQIQSEKRTPTKLEQFELAQKEKVEKANRFEEYLELQTSLLNYFTALNKIEK